MNERHQQGSEAVTTAIAIQTCGISHQTWGWAYLAWLLAQEVVPLLQQDGEGGGGVVVLHGGHIVVANLRKVGGAWEFKVSSAMQTW